MSIFTPEIEKCKLGCGSLGMTITDGNYKCDKGMLCPICQATLSTLQMCEDRFRKFVEELKKELTLKKYPTYQKYSISPDTIFGIIDTLASQSQQSILETPNKKQNVDNIQSKFEERGKK